MALLRLALLLLAACAGLHAARLPLPPRAAPVSGYAADAAARRKLLQTAHGVDQASVLAMLSQWLTLVGAPPSMFNLAFAKLQNTFLVTELVTITDETASLVTSTARPQIASIPGEQL